MAQAKMKEQIVKPVESLENLPYSKYRLDFLYGLGLDDFEIESLPPHASYRRYYRVHGLDKPSLLMDATLDVTEPLMWFINVSNHLRSLGLSAPEVYNYDITDDYSLALIEDWGDDAYGLLIDQGSDPMPMYEKAIDVLAFLHAHENTLNIDVADYCIDSMLSEAERALDWYVPAVCGKAVGVDARKDYLDIWRSIFNNMPPMKDSLVLFDYIFNNMMHLEGREGFKSCGLLDFQMARKGPAIYDIVSLLEDIRRDLPPKKFQSLRRRYLEKSKITDTEDDFDLWFSVMTVQRHCKNLGNLVRLFVRDGKPDLLQYIPRMQGFVSMHLQNPVFADLKHWFEKNDIGITVKLEKGFENANGYPER